MLIGATRLEPLRLADIARARGQTVARVRAARVRAERKLSAYLRDPDRTPHPTLPSKVAVDAARAPITDEPAGSSGTSRGGCDRAPTPGPARGRRRRAAPSASTTSAPSASGSVRVDAPDRPPTALISAPTPRTGTPSTDTDTAAAVSARNAAADPAAVPVRRSHEPINEAPGNSALPAGVTALLVLAPHLDPDRLGWVAAALAEPTAGAARGEPSGVGVSVLALATSVGQVLDNIRNWIIGILGGLATLFLTIGAARYLMAGGDPAEVERARAAFRSAGFGYALALLSPLVVQILKSIVGA